MFMVTGGSGFIGSAVIRELVKNGERAVVFSRSGAKERLVGLEKKIEVVQGDITDFNLLVETIKKYSVSCLIHLAFYTDIQQLEISPGKGTNINCSGFINILEAARQCNIGRVIWTSSVAVYGGIDNYERLPVDEEAPFHPLNVYGAYKAWCEWIGRHYHDNLGVRNIVLRPTIVFGGGRWFRGAATYAYDLFHGPAAGQKVTIDCGDQLVDWLYVKDLANAVILACRMESNQHRVFNICGHKATVHEASEIVKKLMPSAEIEVLPGKRQMWVPYLSTARAENELGYNPCYSLEDAFGEYLGEIQECYYEKRMKGD